MKKEIGTKPKKQIPYWIALIICVAVTCVIANLLTLIFQFGGFTTWETLGKPPSGAVHIVDADGNNVWVEAGNGNLYMLTLYCGSSGNCNQWLRIDDPAEINPFQCRPIKRGPSCINLGGSLLPHNPLTGQVTECIVADGCIPDPEYRSETYFVLMSDGTVRYWEYGTGLLVIYFFFMISTIVLPIFMAIIVSIVYLIKFIARKMHKTGQQTV